MTPTKHGELLGTDLSPGLLSLRQGRLLVALGSSTGTRFNDLIDLALEVGAYLLWGFRLTLQRATRLCIHAARQPRPVS